jgi:hypothetical protein
MENLGCILAAHHRNENKALFDLGSSFSFKPPKVRSLITYREQRLKLDDALVIFLPWWKFLGQLIMRPICRLL